MLISINLFTALICSSECRWCQLLKNIKTEISIHQMPHIFLVPPHLSYLQFVIRGLNSNTPISSPTNYIRSNQTKVSPWALFLAVLPSAVSSLKPHWGTKAATLSCFCRTSNLEIMKAIKYMRYPDHFLHRREGSCFFCVKFQCPETALGVSHTRFFLKHKKIIPVLACDSQECANARSHSSSFEGTFLVCKIQ